MSEQNQTEDNNIYKQETNNQLNQEQSSNQQDSQNKQQQEQQINEQNQNNQENQDQNQQSNDKIEEEKVNNQGQQQGEQQSQAQNNKPDDEKFDYSKIDPDMLNQQLDLIRKEIEDNSPLISDVIDLKELEKEFQNSPIFLQKIGILAQKYPSFRKVRRDGSCFYRAYLFQIFERIITMNDIGLHKKIKEIIEKSKEDLIKVGFEEFVLADFQEALIEKLDIAVKEETNIDTLSSIFCDKMTSDMLVMYMRFMTSGYLKANKEFYECYIDQFLTIDQYCQMEVEPIDKEADQIPMMALISYLQVPVNILYLDQSQQSIDQSLITLPEGTNQNDVFITLLYRPGHYDILYQG